MKDDTRIRPLLSWRSAIAESPLKSSSKLVAYALSLHMKEKGNSAHPGPACLARETGLSLRTVKEHLGVLESEGWLVCVERGGMVGSKRRANEYQAAIPAVSRTRAADSPVQETSFTRAGNRAAPVQQLHTNSERELRNNSRGRDADRPDCVTCENNRWVEADDSTPANRISVPCPDCSAEVAS